MRSNKKHNRSPSIPVETLEPRRLMAAIYWDGGSGMDVNWHNPLNWSTNTVPGPGDDVSAVTKIAATAPISVRSANLLFLQTTSDFSSVMPSTIENFFSTGGRIEGAGTVTMNGGRLTGVTVNAPLIVGNGEVVGCSFFGPLSVAGRMDALGVNTVFGPFSMSTPTQYGTLNVMGGSMGNAHLTIANGFVNQGTIDLGSTTSANTATLNVTNGTLVNRGRINTRPAAAAVAGERFLGAELDNYGFVHVIGSTTLTLGRAGANHVNRHRIDVTAGGPGRLFINNNLNGSFTNASSGLINVESGREVAIHTGTFNSQGGTLQGLGTLSFSDLTANFSANWDNTVGVVNFSASTINGPGIITQIAQNNPLFLHGVVNNTHLVNNGLLTWRGTNAQNGPFTNNVGATMTIETTGRNTTVNFASGFTNGEAATIELCDEANYRARMNVNSGLFFNNGIVKLGARSLISVNGAYAQGGRTTLFTNIEGATAGIGFGQISATGAVTIGEGAGLVATFTGGFDPAATASFAVVHGATVSGRYGSFNNPTTASGKKLMLSYTPADVVMHFVPLVGDVDRDGQVGFADLLLVSANFGRSGAAYIDGDLDGDGKVGFTDLLSVSANFGKPAAKPMAAMAERVFSVTPVVRKARVMEVR